MSVLEREREREGEREGERERSRERSVHNIISYNIILSLPPIWSILMIRHCSVALTLGNR